MDRSKLIFYGAKLQEAVGILATNPSHIKIRLIKAGPYIFLINIDDLPTQELKDKVTSLQGRLAKNFPDEGLSIGRKHTKTLIPIAEDIWDLYFILRSQIDGNRG